jgi:hypothetical protein
MTLYKTSNRSERGSTRRTRDLERIYVLLYRKRKSARYIRKERKGNGEWFNIWLILFLCFNNSPSSFYEWKYISCNRLLDVYTIQMLLKSHRFPLFWVLDKTNEDKRRKKELGINQQPKGTGFYSTYNSDHITHITFWSATNCLIRGNTIETNNYFKFFYFLFTGRGGDWNCYVRSISLVPHFSHRCNGPSKRNGCAS